MPVGALAAPTTEMPSAAAAAAGASLFAPREPPAAAASDFLPFAPRMPTAAAEAPAQLAKTPLGVPSVPLRAGQRELSTPLLVVRGTGSEDDGLVLTRAETNSLASPRESVPDTASEEGDSFWGKVQRVAKKAGKSMRAAGKAVRKAPGKAKRELCRMVACCVPTKHEFEVAE